MKKLANIDSEEILDMIKDVLSIKSIRLGRGRGREVDNGWMNEIDE